MLQSLSVYYYDIDVVLHTGRLAESGHTNDIVHTDARGDEKRADGSDPHGPQSVEAAHQKRTAERPWVLHVPDKHGPHEESNRVSRRSR